MSRGRSEADRRARQSQRIGRALRLLCLIQDRHGRWDLQALAREQGCSTKTVQRDLMALEDAGIPFFYDRQRCCYAVRPGFRLAILDDPPAESSAMGTEPEPACTSQPSSPAACAELSREHAERLLSEAERLVAALDRLCRFLRRSGQHAGSVNPEAE